VARRALVGEKGSGRAWVDPLPADLQEEGPPAALLGRRELNSAAIKKTPSVGFEPQARYRVAPFCNIASRCWYGPVAGVSRRQRSSCPLSYTQAARCTPGLEVHRSGASIHSICTLGLECPSLPGVTNAREESLLLHGMVALARQCALTNHAALG